MTGHVVSLGSPAATSASRRRSVLVAMAAGAGLLAVYASIVGGASGSLSHLADQMRADWYLILPLATGFGVQVTLMVELRRRHRLHGAAAAGVAGTGASTTGMVACCAHHIADLAPFLGASAAATFLTTYKLWFVLVGLSVNAAGIAITARRLRLAPITGHEGDEACEAA